MPHVPAAILRDDRFTGHDTGTHPEHPRRYRAIMRALEAEGLLHDRPEIPHAPATDEALLRVHTRDHLDFLVEATASGGGWIDSDTMVGPDSLDVARAATGAAIAATEAVMRGEAPRAFALGRPPGHHATRDRAMGFCLLNAVAVAAAHARALGARRVGIVDWDVHHGNGTQDIFHEDGDVWYASLHQSPLYPGTGSRAETGHGDGLGTTRNCPLPPGSGDTEWLAAFDNTVVPFIETCRPDIILLSAGYDAHRTDPIGGCLVTDDGYAALAQRTRALADRLCEGRLAVVLEGGYDPAALGRAVVRTVRVLDAATP
jgi:acetoin utilization deacetylase AcuC-like enzyme